MEVVSAKELFAKLDSDLDMEGESTTPELAYLNVIRQVRDNDPKLYALIKRLPKKAKTGKISEKISDEATVTFIRRGALKTFFMSSTDGASQIPFMEAINYIKAEPDEKKIKVSSSFYEQMENNSLAFDSMLEKEEEVSVEKVKITGNDASIIGDFRAMKKDHRFTDSQIEIIDKLIAIWEEGKIPAKVSKDVMKIKTGDILELYNEIIKLVDPVYYKSGRGKTTVEIGEKQIVLSCYMKK